MDFHLLSDNLKKRRFIPHICENAEEARQAVIALIGTKSVGFGGSATVSSMGIYELLEEKGNELHWHWKANKEKKAEERDASQKADVFLSGSNAITMDGRIINIDGTGNRLAGLIYGPSIVICILGRNKIVSSVDEGIERIKRDCCPGNARRLNLNTPCALTGKCMDCRTEARMCNVVAIHEAPTRPVKEFHVFIVNEDLGL